MLIHTTERINKRLICLWTAVGIFAGIPRTSLVSNKAARAAGSSVEPREGGAAFGLGRF